MQQISFCEDSCLEDHNIYNPYEQSGEGYEILNAYHAHVLFPICYLQHDLHCDLSLNMCLISESSRLIIIYMCDEFLAGTMRDQGLHPNFQKRYILSNFQRLNTNIHTFLQWCPSDNGLENETLATSLPKQNIQTNQQLCSIMCMFNIPCFLANLWNITEPFFLWPLCGSRKLNWTTVVPVCHAWHMLWQWG